MKHVFGFLVLYGILGAAAWVVIDAGREHSSLPWEASAAPSAAPFAVRGQPSERFQPVSLPAPSMSLASPLVPAPAPTPTTSWLGDIGKDLNEEFQCLASNVYWEARSESSMGQFAVAAVTLNRVASKRFPGTVCGVVRQGGAKRKNRCQFSWWCDGKSDIPTNNAAWQAAKSIAYTALFFDPPDPTDGALWYHADYVKPSWTRAMSHTATIGRHIYYRKPMQAKRATVSSRS